VTYVFQNLSSTVNPSRPNPNISNLRPNPNTNTNPYPNPNPNSDPRNFRVHRDWDELNPNDLNPNPNPINPNPDNSNSDNSNSDNPNPNPNPNPNEAPTIKYRITSYVNNLLDIKMDFYEPVRDNISPLFLFKDPAHDGPRALVTDLIIWDNVLSDYEVASMYSQVG
jgi:hypothetical protein